MSDLATQFADHPEMIAILVLFLVFAFGGCIALVGLIVSTWQWFRDCHLNRWRNGGDV